jgi:hypothetical protein
MDVPESGRGFDFPATEVVPRFIRPLLCNAAEDFLLWTFHPAAKKYPYRERSNYQ